MVEAVAVSTQSDDQSAGTGASDELQLVVFDLAGEHYGVDIESVREIIRAQEITHIPGAPDAVEGVINLRGRVIPVVDLRKRFNLMVTLETSQSRIVVIEIAEDEVGVWVDAVTEVLRIPASSVEKTSALVKTADSSYLEGIAKVDDRLMMILNLDRALSAEALKSFVWTATDNVEVAAEEDEEAPEEAEQPVAAIEEPKPVAEEPEEEPEPDEEPEEPSGLNLDIDLLEATFELVKPRGDELVAYFYETLLEKHPAVQPLFADVDMSKQQGKLLSALALVVASLRKPEELVQHLQRLGEKHVAYGAQPAHYDAVGSVLLESLAYIAGDAWTPEAEQAWTDAYAVISKTMIDAALALEQEDEAA